MFLLRDKLNTQGEKRETSTKTCDETMLRDKLRVLVSRISPPLLTQINIEARINFTKSEKKKNFVLYNVDVPPRRSIYRTNSGM